MSTRLTIARKVFSNASGEEGRSPMADWSTLTFQFLGVKNAAGEYPVITERKVSRADIPENIFACAAGRGFSEKLTNDALNTVAKDAEEAGFAPHPVEGYAQFAASLFDDALENVMDGNWLSEREGGTAPVRDLVEAIARSWPNAEGGDFPEDKRPAFMKALAANEEMRKATAKRPDVAAHLAAIKAEKAAARAKALKAEAKTAAPSGGLAGLLA